MSKSNIQSEHLKNVILISIDSLRADCVAKLTPQEAPNFCLMRDGGTFFENTIVQAPFTIPSHICMFTGLYPVKTGVRDMHHKLCEGTPTVFSILRKKGFVTLTSSPTGMFKDRGITEIDHQAPFRISKIQQILSNLRGERFFAFLHHWDVHTPYESTLPIESLKDVVSNFVCRYKLTKGVKFLHRLHDHFWGHKVQRLRKLLKREPDCALPVIREGYRKALISADRFLGDILRMVDRIGASQNTLVIVTGDHGDSFNEHDEINRAVDLRYEHGQFLYDNILRVPLILFRPTKKSTRRVSSQIKQIDMLPTLLDALEIEYDGRIDGNSVWGVFDAQGIDNSNEYIFSEVVRESLDLELRSVRTQRSKLICDYKRKRYELYDIRTDPEEKNNIWPSESYVEKDKLVCKLESFAGLVARATEKLSQKEQAKIESNLRALGYLD